MREAIVLVHGIWMTGLDLLPFRHRFNAAGYEPSIFRYPSLKRPPSESAAALADHLSSIDAETVHFLGHSLGGMVLLHLFDKFEVNRPGRVVLLGTPVRGSAVARVLSERRITRPLIGRSGEQGLLGGGPRWGTERQLGIIAGDRALGVGRVLGAIDGPSDGTVAVSETRLEGATDHVVLPVPHSGLVFSNAVFEQVVEFIKCGRFAPEG